MSRWRWSMSHERHAFIDDSPFDPEAIAGTLALFARNEGDAASAAALAYSVPRFEITGHDNWNAGIDYLTLYLAVPPLLYIQLFHVREQIERTLLGFLKSIIDVHPD